MRKRTKRKIYKLVNPIAHAIEGVAYVHGPKLDQLREGEKEHLHRFMNGTADFWAWKGLNDVMNLTENMARHGVGDWGANLCQAAAIHLIDAKKRFEATGRMGLTGLGITCMQDLLEFHDSQRTSVHLSYYEFIIQDTRNRIRSAAPEVLVLEAA